MYYLCKMQEYDKKKISIRNKYFYIIIYKIPNDPGINLAVSILIWYMSSVWII